MTFEERLLLLRPRREQWNNPHVQAFIKGLTIEAEALQKLGMVVTKAGCEKNAAWGVKLSQLGLEPPQTAEDSMRIYLALRAVLNFWTGNLDRLKADSQNAEELEKQIARENDSLGR